jgi:hypothetical protein
MTVAENVLLGLRRRDLDGEVGRRAIVRAGAGRRFVADLSRRYDLDAWWEPLTFRLPAGSWSVAMPPRTPPSRPARASSGGARSRSRASPARHADGRHGAREYYRG